jgi:hypothetical protein
MKSDNNNQVVGQFKTKYIEPRVFIDSQNFVNIKIPREIVSSMSSNDQLVIRKHTNFFLKLFGLPFESIKIGKNREGQQCLFGELDG